MTAVPAPTSSARPAPPPPSLAIPIGLIAFVAITLWAAAGIEFDLRDIVDDLTSGAGILAEFFPPDWSFVPQTVGPMMETLQMAIIASAIGCAVALPVSFLASRLTSPNPVVLAVDRGVLAVVRALPDLLYALVFVAALSIGPLPGIMALVLFNIGVTAKLLSETVDGVDTGPLEAAEAAGATRTEVIRTAVFPQVLPNYVAYSLYVFELNVRASAVIGLVGAGGIGRLLDEQRKFFAYDNLSVIVIELFLFVFIIETISIALRRRLV
jgi:phosphonate transport system permease protein